MRKQGGALIIALLMVAATACQRSSQDEQALHKDPFQQAGKKVLLSIDQLPTEEPSRISWAAGWLSKYLPKSWVYRNLKIKKGTSLAVMVDEDCLDAKHSKILPSGLVETPTRSEETKNKRSPVQTHRVVVSEPITIAQLERAANEDNCVLGVGHNQHASVDSTIDDPMYARQSHLTPLEAIPAYEVFFHSQNGIKKDVVIAVIDTGIDLNHKDLRDNLWVNQAELSGEEGIDDDKNGYVDDIHGYNFASHKGDPSHEIVNDHGTHVAGLAAAVSGNAEGGIGVIGQKVRIMALNVFGTNWGTETVDIDTALRYAADNGAHIINVSVGGPGKSETTAAALAYALNKGALVVASAGNLQQNISDEFYFPASYAARYQGMVSVGAAESSNQNRCDFSSYSPKDLKVIAPGCDQAAPKGGLLSTRAGNSYGYRKGTSMATPLVSGALALTYGLMRDRSGRIPRVEEVEDVFLRSCDHIPALEPYVIMGRHMNLNRLARSLDTLFPVK